VSDLADVVGLVAHALVVGLVGLAVVALGAAVGLAYDPDRPDYRRDYPRRSRARR
jgi:hypothetical protein